MTANKPLINVMISMYIKHFRALVCLLFFSLACSATRAGSLYLPVQMSPEIEARIERLFVIANMPIIKRPIPIKQVNEALDRARSIDPALVSSISRYLDRYSGSAGLAHLSIEASYFEGDNSPMFNNRGLDLDSSYLISGAAYWVLNTHFAVNVGGIAGQRDGGYKDEFPEGSFISLGWDYFQADIGYRSHWFGPFQESDMLISTQASAMPGLTLSNVVPLPFWGIQYELFAVQMSESELILSDDRSQRLQGNPRLAGFHLSFAPIEGFAIGFNRLLQFGGADRDDSLNGLFNAFFNVKESDNIGIAGNDFGNQLSSVTTRYTFAGEFPMSIYMEYAGEDTSASSGVHLGNTSLMFGIHLPKLTEQLDLSWEFAEWQNSWYNNSNYGDGLSHYGSFLGHWGASQRSSSSGASAQTLKLIWDLSDGKALSFKYQSIENENYQQGPQESANRFTLEYAQGLRNIIVGAKYQAGEDVFEGSFNRISGFIRW